MVDAATTTPFHLHQQVKHLKLKQRPNISTKVQAKHQYKSPPNAKIQAKHYQSPSEGVKKSWHLIRLLEADANLLA